MLLLKKEGDDMGVAKCMDEREDQIDQVLDNLRRIVHVLVGHSRRVARLAGLTSAQAWLITTLSIEESTHEKEKASEIERKVNGVRGVRNNIIVINGWALPVTVRLGEER